MNMTAIASSASSSKAITPKYEVFLSFRGDDTRYTFVSHLYAALSSKIKTYIDEKSLERGREISYSLEQAIMSSKVSVVVFSENYASSSWCLDELVHILRFKERKGQIVVPVFYHVKPADIRKRQGSFGKAFSVLEERFKDRPKKVQRWRTALSIVANLSGWDSSAIRDEADLVERIVEDVIRKLNSIPRLSDYGRGLVGIEEQVKQLETLLSIGTRDIRIIGIWGMGGIGKTTLASVVFNRLSSQFRGRCFLTNVREEWNKGRKEDLKKNLFSKLLEEENPSNAWETLCDTKVLIVLDDVNDQDQLEDLIGDGWDSFGDGSRIIVTTRDMQMLRYIRADATYEVKVLNHDEALELFLLNAFKGKPPTSSTGYIKIAERVVNYAKGIPLVLKVLGSFLRCKAQENWASELNELEQAPNEKIQNVLKISYDLLHERDQQIFLDIACFFDWTDRECAEEFWTACGLNAKTKVDNLIEKSLLSIRDSNTLWMHDLIKEMGREIVKSTKELGKRSRLWKAEDVIHVLKNNIGTEEMEGIYLQTYHIANVDLGPTVFRRMPNLRFLKVKEMILNTKLQFPQGLDSLPTALRYLEWHFYPLKSLPPEFSPRNLVEIHMPFSILEKLWDGVQDLGNLKRIDLSFSCHLTQIPDLSRALKLEKLNLKNCGSLVEVPDLSFLCHLTKISDLAYDKKLDSSILHTLFIRIPRLKIETFDKHSEKPRPLVNRGKPGTLDLSGCSSLKLLQNISGNLQHLHLGSTAVEELPTSICSLNNLLSLDLGGCKRIKNLPSSICNLTSLKHLSLRACSSISTYPENIPASIVVLDLGGTNILQLPESISHVTCLEEFCLNHCASLEELPTSICELKSLRSLYLYGCSRLENFPEISKPMECFRTLDLRQTGIVEIRAVSFEKLIGLHNLLLDSCENLEFVSERVVRITSLRNLTLTYYQRSKIPDWLDCLSSLATLSLVGSCVVTLPPNIKDLSMLTELYISDSKNLQSLPELPLSLGLLDASGCTSLKSVSNSKTALLQGHWNDYQVTYYKQLLFCDCSNLDPISRDNILIDSHIRILHTATTYVSQREERSRVFDEKPVFSVCCPGNEILNWFSYTSERSSIDIELPPNWHNNSFIGFALCAVVGEHTFGVRFQFEVKCEYYFKTKNGRSPKFHCQFPQKMQSDPMVFAKIPKSDHMLMWYKYEDYPDYRDAAEVSFKFSFTFKRSGGYKFLLWSQYERIRRCGIRLLYLQDAEEFGIVHNAKPDGDATVGSDTCEPHTKRPQFSNS